MRKYSTHSPTMFTHEAREALAPSRSMTWRTDVEPESERFEETYGSNIAGLLGMRLAFAPPSSVVGRSRSR